jgi:hypothetical protein
MIPPQGAAMDDSMGMESSMLADSIWTEETKVLMPALGPDASKEAVIVETLH